MVSLCKLVLVHIIFNMTHCALISKESGTCHKTPDHIADKWSGLQKFWNWSMVVKSFWFDLNPVQSFGMYTPTKVLSENLIVQRVGMLWVPPCRFQRHKERYIKRDLISFFQPVTRSTLRDERACRHHCCSYFISCDQVKLWFKWQIQPTMGYRLDTPLPSMTTTTSPQGSALLCHKLMNRLCAIVSI